MQLPAFVFGLFMGGAFTIVGLVAVALRLHSVRGTPLNRVPALLWRDEVTLRGLWTVGVGSFALLMTARSYIQTFASTGLGQALYILVVVAFLGGMVAWIRAFLLGGHARRHQLERREPLHNA
jgi:hypothetical protein